MAAITDLDALVNRMTGGNSGTPEIVFIHKDNRYTDGTSRIAPVAGRHTSLWNHPGITSHGTYPSTGADYPTNATAGAIPITNPSGGRQKWLVAAGCVHSGQAGSMMLYDRLATFGAISSATSGSQSCSMTLSGRYSSAADCVGNRIAIEIATATGSIVDVECTYNDQDNNSQTSSFMRIGGTGMQEIGRILYLPYAAGTTGVRSVSTVSLSAASGTGTFAVMIIRPLLYLRCPVLGYAGVRNLIGELPAPVEIKTDACLALDYYPSSTTWPTWHGFLSMVEA